MQSEKEAENNTDFEYDHKMESWLPVLNKRIPLKAHVHRADDILTAIRIAKLFDLDLTLDHCTEGHLICEEIKHQVIRQSLGRTLHQEANRYSIWILKQPVFYIKPV